MDPLGALQSRFFNDVPLIIGHNKHEFAHIILPYLKNQTNLRHFLNNWAISGPAILFNRYKNILKGVIHKPWQEGGVYIIFHITSLTFNVLL